MRRRIRTLIAIAVISVVTSAGFPMVPAGAAPARDLDVMFIGAHPDDEAGLLSVYGQWNEFAGMRTGVITITRGEGGGNAVGLEEGPALGLLREREERDAVGLAGIENVYNLDKVDFYYNVSAPLTEQAWGREDTLERVVRVLRHTRPETIVTMNPSPNTHGHHQMAARLAVEAFYAAADPSRFPEQITEEGLKPFRARKIFRNSASVSGATNGASCAESFVPNEPAEDIYAIWGGVMSQIHGKTWAAVERDAQRLYASQGWARFPDLTETPPEEIGCDRLTLIDSRVPYTRGNTAATAALEGANLPARGGFPLGTEFYLTTDEFSVAPGQTVAVTAHFRAAAGASLGNGRVSLTLPAGWTLVGNGRLGAPDDDGDRTATMRVRVPAGAEEGRVRIAARLRGGGMRARTGEQIEVSAPVVGTLEPLAEVAEFRQWAQEAGAPQLDSLITPLLQIGSGQSRSVNVNVANNASTPSSGSVALELPDGFTADAVSKPFDAIAPGETETVTFEVTNTDATLPTANSEPEGGYPVTVTTTSGAGTAVRSGALIIVPTTTIPGVEPAPTIDGVAGDGEYPGPTLDLSRVWEGQAATTADASGTARLSWHDDALYVFVDVTDDVLGTVLTPEDAKRHWRTDSVELTFDPRGDSANTSTTFKVGIFPITDDPGNGNPPAAYRDADNFQGPVATTAPGMEIASVVREPYDGYTIEAKIPLATLPSAVDPERFAANVLIYDSDTQDRTGQSRLGWSTFNGVQGTPYRWGLATLEGYEPPADRPTAPTDPVYPTEAAQSVESPQSIIQHSRDGVPLAGKPPATRDESARLLNVRLRDDRLVARLRGRGAGTAHVFAWDGDTTVASAEVEVSAGERQRVVFFLTPEQVDALSGGRLAVGWEADSGRLQALSRRIP